MTSLFVLIQIWREAFEGHVFLILFKAKLISLHAINVLGFKYYHSIAWFIHVCDSQHCFE